MKRAILLFAAAINLICSIHSYAELHQYPGKALDIAVGPAGSLWAVGTDNLLYQFKEGAWKSRGSTSAQHVAVGPGGQVWVIDTSGAISRLNGDTFERVSGLAVEIAIGPDGDVYVLGSVRDSNGNYPLLKWDGNNWAEVSSPHGTSLAVGPGDTIWLTNANGDILRGHKGAWVTMPGAAHEIAAGSDGSVYVLGTQVVGTDDWGIFKWNGTAWVGPDGGGKRIAAGPNGGVIVTNSVSDIYGNIREMRHDRPEEWNK